MRPSSIGSALLLLLAGGCVPASASPTVEPAEPADSDAEPEPASQEQSAEPAARMDTTQIKAGVDKLNPGVLACGERLGLTSGTKIPVRFVIEGSTGSITELEVLPPADAGLVDCVEQAIVDAGPGVFPTFAAAEQQFQFNFRMR